MTSTNPLYEGNTAGVVAHLTNTLKKTTADNIAYGDHSVLIPKFVEAVTQRWHLIPADEYEGTLSKGTHEALTRELRRERDDLREQAFNYKKAFMVAFGNLVILTQVQIKKDELAEIELRAVELRDKVSSMESSLQACSDFYSQDFLTLWDSLKDDEELQDSVHSDLHPENEDDEGTFDEL